MSKQSQKHLPSDPTKPARLRECVRNTSAAKSRSRLAPMEAEILEMRLNGHTYKFIRSILYEHLQWAPAISTLYEYIRTAEKRRAKFIRAAKKRGAEAGSAAALVPPPAQHGPAATASIPVRENTAGGATRAAIQRLKAESMTADAKSTEGCFISTQPNH